MRRSNLASLLLLITALALLYACDTSFLTPAPTTQPSSGGYGPGVQRTATTGTAATAITITGRDSGNNVASNPGGAIPVNAPKPAPPQNTYKGCPSRGDGGDPQLNTRKNRTDSAVWYPVSVQNIVNLPFPFAIGGQPRSLWSAANAAQVARYEGIPVQVEGYLAGAKQQGPESCNCHSTDDVDNHLWIVSSPNESRATSLVAEITPRVRAQHPGWAFSRVLPLVNSGTKVRISGWLMMDQEHPDQIGKTRGTIWEIHPIIAFDVQRGSGWVDLDTGRVSTTQSAGGVDAAPTVDPNLPPPITDPFQGGEPPTPTPRPASTHAGGQSVSAGDVHITDIFYNGAINPNEPDEYVEITNVGANPVNMDGWVLHDIYGGQEFTWHGFTIQPGQKIRVYTDQVHPETGGFSFGSRSAIWANKGDAGELIDASGAVVSTFSYGNKK